MKIIIIFCLFIFCSCGRYDQPSPVDAKYPRGIQILKIDECEYISYTVYSTGCCIIHKANCNNPIHSKQNKSQ